METGINKIVFNFIDMKNIDPIIKCKIDRLSLLKQYCKKPHNILDVGIKK